MDVYLLENENFPKEMMAKHVVKEEHFQYLNLTDDEKTGMNFWVLNEIRNEIVFDIQDYEKPIHHFHLINLDDIQYWEI